MELHDFLLRRVYDDMKIAQEASRRIPGGPSVIGGVDWFWSLGNDTDAPVHPDYEHVGGEVDFCVSLRSRQEWDVKYSDQPLPQFAIHEAEEVQVPVGKHIETFDPKRVTRAVAAKRGILYEHSPVLRDITYTDGESEQVIENEVCGRCVPRNTGVNVFDPSPGGPCATLRYLATEYDEHPDYRPEWRP
jgi:hypothetical protein